jgi:phthalate 4,5-cis-dihydrodiol dehydrogenase
MGVMDQSMEDSVATNSVLTDATGAFPRRLKMAIAGIGQGGGGMLPAMAGMPQMQLVAGADINPLTRERFQAVYPETRVYPSVAELCADPEVEAVWVSSPNRFHCEHAIEALQHGKHVVVEKPMAVSLEEADRMIDAASRNGVTLIAGHTNSFELHIRAMRKVIASGRIGRLCAVHITSYTDWMLRARTPDELDPNQGGGIPWRQGPHQIDVVRLLGGGLLRSVRGTTGDWFRERKVPGYQSAFFDFEDGASATILHNGYGYFLTSELFPWLPEARRYTYDERAEIRRSIRDGSRDEETEKQAFRIGGSRDPNARRAAAPQGPKPWDPADLGIVIASCERGDIRNSQYGLYVYADDGRFEIPLAGNWAGLQEHRAELEELYSAVVGGRPVYHSGEWGAATLEACLALIQSARERREVLLQRQIAMPAGYDDDLTLPSEQPITSTRAAGV